ncbi:unnamed protein product [Caenorhabditis angaria]|uniref:F-box domain-containing protein n=1 Tax=Caenorhabditis angaria TaxID=860376 RepID=A0A9P1J4Q0_9PELO|nr:unnamed protein product [Caenorhabditis angaria]
MSDMDISTIDCENEHSPTLSDVPIDVVEKIQTYLESIDIVRLRSVSKSIQENLDMIDQTESLMGSDISHVLHFAIRDNDIEIHNEAIPKYQNNPVKYPPEDLQFFPITGIRQLNWYRPIWLHYENSTILESSLDLTDFLEDVQDLLIINIINTTDPINLRFNPIEDDPIWLTLNGNIPFYKKSIMSQLLKNIRMGCDVCIDSSHEIERDFDEDEYEGIELFMKTEIPGSKRKLNFVCPKSVCDKLVELSHKWFGHGETRPGVIKNGQNTVNFRR